MTILEKAPESSALVRFQDCDPLGHLNNSKYIDYMINAREDHLINIYDINIFKLAQTEGRTWVVGQHELSYVKPAFVMEKVILQTRLIHFAPKYVQAEMVMMNANKSQLKAVLWSKFFHYDVRTQKSIEHSAEHMSLFEQLVIPPNHTKVEERARHLAAELNSESAVA